MANDKGRFVVVVRSSESPGAGPDVFWGGLVRVFQPQFEAAAGWAQGVHYRFLNAFPSELLKSLREYMLVAVSEESSAATDRPAGRPSDSGGITRFWRLRRGTALEEGEARVRTLLREIHFRVTDVRYESMTFAVDVTGVQALIELFEKNYDLLRGFLETYVPAAIILAAGVGGTSMPFPVEIRDAQIRRLFRETGSPPTVLGKGTMPFGTTFSAWAITNFTLIVPVILATLFVYWAVVATANERERLVKSWETLAERHGSAMANERERVVRLVEFQEKLTVGLIAKERECCVQRAARGVARPRPCPPASSEAAGSAVK